MIRLAGKATAEGTKKFLDQSKLSMRLELNNGLSINPCIHGPPRYLIGPNSADLLIETAVLRNRSNAVVVFSNSNRGIWFSNILPSLMRTYHKEIHRDQIVTIAALGAGHNIINMAGAIEEVKATTLLEHLDIVYIDATLESFSGSNAKRFADNVQLLEKLCVDGQLSGFGIHMSLPPYMYHSPMRKQQNKLAMLPMFFEDELSKTSPHCSFVMYTISPSHAIPGTYPMLTHTDHKMFEADGKLPRSATVSTRLNTIDCR